MQSDRKLRVGHIPYLNCVPFFHYLKDCGFSGQLVSGVPSELNQMLQQGLVDVSPSSSFEYARNWRDYLLLPGHSISSFGSIQSVLLFSPVPLVELEGQQIAITGESATSINLLRIILREFVGLTQVLDAVPLQPVEQLVFEGKPALLIGDRALMLAANPPSGMHCFDLGLLWYQYTGLPFVFALWMVRCDALAGKQESLSMLGHQLKISREKAFFSPGDLLENLTDRLNLPASTILDYWQSISFDLDTEHFAGFREFTELCLKYGYLLEKPEIRML